MSSSPSRAYSFSGPHSTGSSPISIIFFALMERVEWDPEQEYDRLGLDDMVYGILGVDLHYLKIPVRPGRNLTSIIEVAATNFILKGMGYHPAREFHEKLLARMEVRPLGDEVE